MKMPWAKTICGQQGSQVMLVDSRGHPTYQAWVLMAVGIVDETNAKVQLTRKGMVALRNALSTAIALDKQEES
jgi:hypothetical protein